MQILYGGENGKNGRRDTNCSFPHSNMCFRFICQGNKGCIKGASCQYAHPKSCRASLTIKRCNRRNCYYYHVAGILRPFTEGQNTTIQKSAWSPPKKTHVKSQPGGPDGIPASLLINCAEEIAPALKIICFTFPLA